MTTPLTRYILAILATPSEKLGSADPGKLAAKYGISPAHASGYLRMLGTQR